MLDRQATLGRESGGHRQAPRWLGPLALFVLVLAIYNANGRSIPSGDTTPASLLPFSLVGEGNFDLGEFAFASPAAVPTKHFSAVASAKHWQPMSTAPAGWLAPVAAGSGVPRLLLRDPAGAFWEARAGDSAPDAWQRVPVAPLAGHGRPAAVEDQAGATHLFAVDEESTLQATTGIGGSWSKWLPLPGAPATDRAPAATRGSDATMHLVVLGLDGQFHARRFVAGAWSDWRTIAAGIASQAFAIVADERGAIHIVLEDGGGRLWHCRAAAGEACAPWREVPALPQLAGFAAAADASGAVRLVAEDRDGQRWSNLLAGEAWSGWRTEPGPALPQRAGPRREWAALAEGPQRLWLFASEVPAALPWYVQFREGRVLSSYPVMVPLAVTPLYLPLRWSARWREPGFFDPDPRWPLFRAVGLMEKLSASLIAAASVLVLLLALRKLCEPRAAWLLAAVYALGTNTWTIGSQALWQHGLSELALAVMALGLLEPDGRRAWLALAGVGAAVAAASRPPNGVFLVLALAYLWREHQWRAWPFVLGPAVVGALQVIYNLAAFGAVSGGYGALLSEESLLSSLFSLPSEGLAGVLVSPSRGLFVYTPVMLFSFWGLVLAWRNPRLRLFRYLGLGVLAQVWLYGQFRVWWGGHAFGPRFLTDVLPLLCLFLAPAWAALRVPLARAAFLAAALVSVAVQVTGAFYYPAGYWDDYPETVDSAPERLWDWRDSQLLRSLRHGPFVPDAE